MIFEGDPIAAQFAIEFQKLISDREAEHPSHVVIRQCPECPDVSTVDITLTKFQAWVLMSQLQLALRHPGNSGPTSEIAKSLALTLQTAVTSGNQILYEVAQRGWNPEFDG